MSKVYESIKKTSDIDRAAIARKTAYSLPDEPSAVGMRPDQIRRHFWAALIGEKQSMQSELDRLVNEVNAALDAIWGSLFGGALDYSAYEALMEATKAEAARAQRIVDGADIPAVTEKDEGKVMQVVDGKWQAVALPVWEGGSY